MLKEERQQQILREVSIHSRIQLSDMAEVLDVSVDTIRRDVKELHDQHKLKKVHGGAISLGYNVMPFEQQEVYNREKKISIARKAVTLLKENQVVLMSGGTTNQELVRQIPPDLKLTVFTPSLPIALQLLTHPEVEVVFLGGKISKDAQLAVGVDTVQELMKLRADICFLGTGYLDVNQGLTEFDYDVVQIKRAMIKTARKNVSLCISDKLNSVQRFKTCDVGALDYLITELDPDDPALAPYRGFEVTLM